MSSKIFLGKSKKLTRKHVKGAIELFEKDGFNVSRIAKIYGVSRSCMERVLAGNGVLELSKSSIIDDDMIHNAGVLYNIGKMSLARVGESLGVSRWTVKKALHLGSIRTRREMNKGVHKKTRRRYAEIGYNTAREIIDTYCEGSPATKIASKMNLSLSKVYFTLAESGIQMRPRGRYKKVAK